MGFGDLDPQFGLADVSGGTGVGHGGGIKNPAVPDTDQFRVPLLGEKPIHVAADVATGSVLAFLGSMDNDPVLIHPVDSNGELLQGNFDEGLCHMARARSWSENGRKC